MYYTCGTKITFQGKVIMKDDKSCTTKLSTCNLGISLGVVYGLTSMLLVYLGVWFGLARGINEAYSQIFHGWAVTYKGGLIAFCWGFLQGYISGVILANVYNFCSCRCPCSSCKTTRKH